MYKYDKKKRQLAKRYTHVKLTIGVFNGIFVPLIFLFLLLASGLNPKLFNFASAYGIFTIPIYAFIFMTLLVIVQFHVRFYSSFVYEHKYKLSNHTLKSWFTDYFKGLLIAYIFFVLLITGLFVIFG